MKDNDSLAHTTWNCKYHIVFAPKYRRQVIYGQLRGEIGKILRMLCERKEIEIIEAECCPDHIHMLVRISPKYSVSEIVGYLKGKSSLMIAGSISPVELAKRARQINHPLCGCASKVIPKTLPLGTMRLFKPQCSKERRVYGK